MVKGKGVVGHVAEVWFRVNDKRRECEWEGDGAPVENAS